MLNYLRHKKLFDELPDSYPAEIFIDFVLTQGYIVIEDTPTYTLVKNEETGFTERIHESERNLEAFKEFLREMELKKKIVLTFLLTVHS